ncbi:MAG: ATP-binding cassette domain-containing protein, partial [Ilumatobacter sp.]|nr:ATP-binding cassette domain-containing protein [Ilumatobacter sp.]
MNPLIVHAQDVARTFGQGPGAVVAVHSVSCEIHAGDQIAVSGASGSGKTTLLHLLAGLDTPTTGTISWPAIGARADLRPGPVAVVFQAPSLLPPLDVVENVALPLLLAGADRRSARAAAMTALERLALEPLAG